MLVLNQEQEISFWSKIDKRSSKDGCWLWTRPTKKGFGQLWVDKTNIPAHYVSWELHNGSIPQNTRVQHCCHSDYCVNPDHLSLIRINLSVEERFWSKVDKSGGNDACWLWKGCVVARYGAFGINSSKMEKAHRFAYEFTYGKIPDGLLACHKCDNTICVNPSHIFIGTNKDNNIDRTLKGRGNLGKKLNLSDDEKQRRSQQTKRLHESGIISISGENNKSSKFSSNVIISIRNDRKELGLSYMKLSSKYGVSESQVGRIVRNTSWKCLLEDE